MILSSRHPARIRAAFLLTTAVCIFTMAAPDTADARGSVGGGGFSRSSPASSGSISSNRISSGDVSQSRAVRETRDITQPRAARNTGDIGQPRSAGSAGGAQSAGGVSATAGAGQARAVTDVPVTAQQMAAYRQQFAAQNVKKDNWDENWQGDPEYGVSAPVRPAVVVGATAVARNRADDYVDYVNTVDDPAELSELPCTIEAVVAVSDVTYYRCEKAWYKRGYQSGSVVYIQTDAPAGY
jgi:hypothetical protein